MSRGPAPHTEPVQTEAVNLDDYVRAMAQYVSSVCIITTQAGGERFGLTATAVSSVCTTPPRLLVCVNKSGVTHEMIREAGHFCVNVLAEDQDHLAKVFAGMAGKSAERFGMGAWNELVSGSPCLAGAASVFDCRVAALFDQHTHTVFFGDVVATRLTPSQDPLLYGLRRFRHLRKIYSRADSSEGEMLHL